MPNSEDVSNFSQMPDGYHALQRQELMHIVLAELIAAFMLIWLAVEAVYHENAFELLASAVVACCVSARLIYFIVSHMMLEVFKMPCLQISSEHINIVHFHSKRASLRRPVQVFNSMANCF